MRFIGNKEKLLENIYQVVLSTGITEGSFFDFFSGTSNVGRYFKEKGFSVQSSDLLFFSYVLQRAYIQNNKEPQFEKITSLSEVQKIQKALFQTPLEQVLSFLNNLDGVDCFIYENYTEEGTAGKEFIRKFFIGENGKKIDAIRQKIEEWFTKKMITEDEYYILLACLIESVPFYANISGVYAAFLKNYDPRALKPFEIRPIKIYPSKHEHKVYNKNSVELIEEIDVDILYLDPPYNARQYAPNYHLLETIAKYDNPKIKGITGMRDYKEQKSDFCNAKLGIEKLEEIAKKAKYQYLLLSYNSEGIMPQGEIMRVLSKFGNVELKEIDYLRFKSNSNGDSAHKKYIQEQIYLLHRK